MELGRLAATADGIRRWLDYVPDSPLYTHLTLAVCDDPELLAVVARIENVPPMNLLFGAVKLGLTSDDALAAWYPHLAGEAARPPDADAARAFREYVLGHAEEIVRIGATRRTQTNEVGRSAVLLPWVAAAARELGEPVHAIDVGASAGLNLCMDKFAYAYGDDRVGAGDVVIECENRGGFTIPDRVPEFVSRTGLELHPVDATDDDQAAWLEALVWPEHTDRLARLRAAIQVRRDVDVRMVAGDATETLLDIEAELAPGPVVIWHTIAVYQFSEDGRAALDAAVADIASRRDVVRVSLETTGPGSSPEVRVGLAPEHAKPVAVAHAHGRWIDRPPPA